MQATLRAKKVQKSIGLTKAGYRARSLLIPKEIVEEVERGTISIKQAYLLAIVDSLVDVKGEGCWASNEWLGDRIQVKERQVMLYISDLIAKGFIQESESKSRGRVMETKWSRVHPEVILGPRWRRRNTRESPLSEAQKIAPPETPTEAQKIAPEDPKMAQKIAPDTGAIFCAHIEDSRTRSDDEEEGDLDDLCPAPLRVAVRDHQTEAGRCPPPEMIKKKEEETPIQKEISANTIQKNTKKKRDRKIPDSEKIIFGKVLLNNTELENWYSARAVQLYTALLSKGLVSPHRTHQVKWAREFKKLADEGWPKEVIEECLTKYIAVLGQPFIPRAFSAQSFREKFSHIKFAVESPQPNRQESRPAHRYELPKDQSNSSSNGSINYAEDESVKVVLTHLKHLVWPMGAGKLLPKAVYESLESYQRFRADLRAVRAADARIGGVGAFAERMLLMLTADVEQFVIDWYTEVHRRVAGWRQWNGVLKPWSVTSKEFMKVAYSVATDWSWKESEWDELLDELGKLP